MCNWTEREFCCEHKRLIANEWCFKYINTHKRCHPKVTHRDYKGGELCSDCKNKKTKREVAWEHLIDRTKYTEY
ncbi:hypothetical protein CGCF415_v002327 [Colletotrichum fructicola]|nr:hypothetical protein CGCF415_v002327 [Colletotrichum fructicola]